MKKKIIIISLLIILVLLFILVKFVYFSPTQVKIVDIDGNPIQGAAVRISYSCQLAILDVGGGEHFNQFGYQEGITDSKGIVSFNSLNKKLKYNFPFMFNCHKDASVLKGGYCPNHEINARRCIGDYSVNLLSKKEISELPVYFTKAISWFKGETILVLKKIENYVPPTSNISCKIFIEKCLEYNELNNAIEKENASFCDKPYTTSSGTVISFVDECFTELAHSSQDPEVCKSIYYNSEGNGLTNARFSETPEADTKEFQKRCFNNLAIELEDISLCTNYRNDREFEYCKFDVVKEIGDIEMCSQIRIKDIRDFCEVYLS